ncbi:MAG: flagellin [SAR324 cluster bacterium]|nr:flagellin [SAR324 cluster bacterium]
MRIRHNAAGMSTLRNSRMHQNRVQNSIEKLSSGSALNRAKDAPADLYQAEMLRSQASGLKQAAENAEHSISLLQTAGSFLGDISSKLTEMRQLAVQSSNEATNDPATLEANQYQLELLLSSILSIAEKADFGGKKLLDGSMGVNGVTVGENLKFIEAAKDTPSSPEKGFPIDITHTATRSSMVGQIPLTVDSIGEGFVIRVKEGSRLAVLDTREGDLFQEIEVMKKRNQRKQGGEFQDPFNFSFAEDAKLEKSRKVDENQKQKGSESKPTGNNAEESLEVRQFVLFHLNQKLADNNLNVQAVSSHDGRLILHHFEYGDKPKFQVSCSIPEMIAREANAWEESFPGKNVEGTIGGGQAIGDGMRLTANTGGPAQGAVVEYSGIPGTFKIPVLDPRGRHINNEPFEQSQEMLLGSVEEPIIEGYLHITQQSQSVQTGESASEYDLFSLNDVRPSKLGSGIMNPSQFKSISDIDLTMEGGAEDAVLLINKATQDVSDIRLDIGSFEKNALQRAMQNVETEALGVNSSRSRLQDTDSAKEIANLTQSQIQLNTSQALTGHAYQKPMHVMKLLNQ